MADLSTRIGALRCRVPSALLASGVSEGRLLARNSALNLAGLVLPMAVAVLTIPALVRGLGAERFGILTLAWAAIGYFGLFELGLSRALTQRVAQKLGNGEMKELGPVSWSALALLLALGVIGALLFAVLSPLLVTRVLNVPPELQRETLISFYILALSLPLVVTGAGLRGLMEAHQHFGVVMALRLPMIAFMFVGPLLALPFSRSLVPAVTMLAAGRTVGFVAHVWYCYRKYPFLRERIVVHRSDVSALLRFGGWSTVTNVVSPMMVYLDRFVIGALLPLAAVAHYVTPYELVTKLLVIPGAILGAMFPALAASSVSNVTRMGQLYERAIRAVLLFMFPLVLVFIALAREGLLLWMGPALPPDSTLVLQWLAVGVFVNAIGQAPYAALQGAGRPDVIAKLHVIELPLYVAAIYFLVKEWGLPGVAIAWTLRVAVDAVALLWMARRTLGLSFAPRLGGWSTSLMLAAFAIAATLEGVAWRLLFVTASLAVFLPVAWRTLLRPAERDALRRWIQSPRTFAQAGSEEPA